MSMALSAALAVARVARERHHRVKTGEGEMARSAYCWRGASGYAIMAERNAFLPFCWPACPFSGREDRKRRLYVHSDFAGVMVALEALWRTWPLNHPGFRRHVQLQQALCA